MRKKQNKELVAFAGFAPLETKEIVRYPKPKVGLHPSRSDAVPDLNTYIQSFTTFTIIINQFMRNLCMSYMDTI